MTVPGLVWSNAVMLCVVIVFAAPGGVVRPTPVLALSQAKAGDQNNAREVAARFAPIFYQALGDKPRSDYITNFDFDGDWRGDNNWENGGNESIPLNAYIYYSVAETSTHY